MFLGIGLLVVCRWCEWFGDVDVRIALFSGVGFVFFCWWAAGLAVAVALFAHCDDWRGMLMGGYMFQLCFRFIFRKGMHVIETSFT